MRNKDLAKLNFSELLDYGGQPIVQNIYDPSLSCSGYCIDCEEKGIFSNSADSFDQMSHGCDTSDFEVLLGRQNKEKVGYPIVFLLENPGGDYGNGEVVSFKGYKKQPPVNHYYWTPNIDTWPEDADNLPNLYGPYFAYLMSKHSLNNVYITNLIKCNIISSQKTEYRKQDAILNCVDKWLKREIEIFLPKLMFCFGHSAEKEFKQYSNKYGWNILSLYLYHPSAIALAQRYNKTPKQMITENDSQIDECLKNVT